MKKKVNWSKQAKGRSIICCYRGRDGDLFIGYEAGIPLRARELLSAYYQNSQKIMDVEKLSYLLDKEEQRWLLKHKKWFESLGLLER